jgi:hypothetical protein
VLTYAPLGDPALDRFQQNVARELARIERLIPPPVTPPGLELVETRAISTGGIWTFSALRGDERTTLGYLLVVGIDTNGAGSVQYRMRINGDAGASAYRYAYATIGNGGAMATGAGDDTADAILLNGVTAVGQFTGTLAIPLSRSGADRLVLGELAETGHATIRGDIVRASWVNTTDPITAIEIYADGSDVPRGVVSLYRTVR